MLSQSYLLMFFYQLFDPIIFCNTTSPIEYTSNVETNKTTYYYLFTQRINDCSIYCLWDTQPYKFHCKLSCQELHSIESIHYIIYSM